MVVAGFFYIRHKILTSPLPKNIPEEDDSSDLTDPTNSGLVGNMFHKRNANINKNFFMPVHLFNFLRGNKRHGELRAYIMSDDGREITLFRLGEGQACVLSVSCVLSNISFESYIDAVSDTEALLISSPVFARLSEHNVYIENFALRLAADRFSDIMGAMEQILFTSFDKRLAKFLLEESDRSGSATITMTHEQIAKYIGSAREVVSRMLKNFEHEGIVALHRGSTKEIIIKIIPEISNPVYPSPKTRGIGENREGGSEPV